MPFRAFLSYRHTERDWALKLVESLSRRGIDDVFFDKQRLDAGHRWDDQLDKALGESQHLIVLWSEAAMDPKGFVDEERRQFEFRFYRPSLNDPAALRKMIYVVLNADAPPAARNIHTINDVRDAAGAYQAGAANVPSSVWTSVVDQVARALTEGDRAIPVGLIVLASTAAGIDGLNFERRAGQVVSLNDALLPLGLTPVSFRERYGNRPEDWRPYGQDRPLLALMNELKDRVNARLAQFADPDLAQMRIRWELPSDAFWTSPATPEATPVEDEVRRWRNQPLVVVIDPLSLYDPDVRQRLDALSDNLTSGLATFMALGTQPVPATHGIVRSLLRGEARRLHQLFWDPELPLVEPRAGGGINVDIDEMQRFVLTAIGNFCKPRVQRPAAPVIETKGLH
jgi:hypothetical protein